jgi:choline-sulfatase
VSLITRRTFAEGVAAGVGAAALRAGTQGRPNLLILCSDQHSGLALGANGHPVVHTPNLDRLAAMGVNFRNAYSCAPVCVPGRASLMTGMYASDVGSYCNSTPFDGRVSTWGNRLRNAGYDCWATGKLDLKHGVDYGFDEVSTDHGHWFNPDICSLFRDPVCFRPGERASADGAFRDGEHHDSAVLKNLASFLKGRTAPSTRPWMAWVGLLSPHPPFVAQRKYLELYPPDRMLLPNIPPDYLEKRHPAHQVLANYRNISTPLPDDRIRRARSAYFGMITELDANVGRVLADLEHTGQIENTVIAYTSDHGEMLGNNGLWLKNTLLEGAARIPLILAGPGIPKGRTVDAPVCHTDLAPTLLELGEAPAVKELRGRSLLPLARGDLGAQPGFAFSESHSEGNCTGSFMIRRGDWKYIYFTGDRPLLFNLKNDPGELHDLAGRPETSAVRKDLHAALVSLLDPDAVTERAFAEQERRLAAMVARMSAADFYRAIVGRLGPMQARILTNKHYRRRS